MFRISLKREFLMAVALGLPVAAMAQEGSPAAGQTAEQQEVQTWLAELEGLHSQLEALQNRALEDPELSAAQEELGDEIRGAITAADPSIQQRMDRMGELETEASAASQGGNMQRLQELMTEARDIQDHFFEVQQRVLETPELAAKLNSFQDQLQRKMLQLDPGAQALMDRFRELEGKLTEALGPDA